MKATFRIVKVAGYRQTYRVDKKVLFFWWVPITGNINLEDAEWRIRDQLETLRVKAENPKDVVIKTVTLERN